MLKSVRAIVLFVLMIATASPTVPAKTSPAPVDQTEALFMALAEMTLRSDTLECTAGFWNIGKLWKKHKKEIIAAGVVVVMVTVALISGNKSNAPAERPVATTGELQKPDPMIFEKAPAITTLANEYKTVAENFFPKEIAQEIITTKPESLSDKAREHCAYFVHTIADEIAEYMTIFPQIIDEAKKIAPYTGGALSNINWDACGKCTDSYETTRKKLHAGIDKTFKTNYAKNFTEKSDQENLFPRTIAELPPPGQIGSLARTSLNTLKKIITAGKNTKEVAKYLGLTSKEITALRRSHQLKPHLTQTIDHIYKDRKHIESLNRFQRAKPIYRQYSKKPYPEPFIRNTIEKLGIRTYPRPKGIPDNYITKFSEKVGGIIYVDPLNSHNAVRVMPGQIHSPNKYQQRPYVKQVKNGHYININGKTVLESSAEAHIPLEKFKYRG